MNATKQLSKARARIASDYQDLLNDSSYDDLLAVLHVAEYGCFGIAKEIGEVSDTQVTQPTEEEQAHSTQLWLQSCEANIQLAQKLCSSEVPHIRASVERALAANTTHI